MQRRSFLKYTTTSLAGACLLPAALTAKTDWHTYKDLVIGHGTHRYKIDMNWGALDARYYPVNDCHEMVQDRQGRIILLTNHTKNNVIVYDKKGRLLEVWGTEYPGAHGLTLSEEGGEEFLYICDNNRHEVIKTTMKGQVVQVYSYPKSTGKYQKIEEFIPTESAVAPNGDVYVADGYGAQYITQYSQDGKVLNIFGGRGEGDQYFDNAHGIALETRFDEPSLLITARQRNQVKRFTLDGTLQKVIDLPGANICRPVIHGDHLYFATLVSRSSGNTPSGFVCILNEKDELVSAPGANKPTYKDGDLQESYQTLKVFQHPHDVCIDEDENLYVAQWNSGKTYPIKLLRID